MSQSESLQPIYDFSSAPRLVSLFQGKVKVELDGQTLLGTAELKFQLSPESRVFFRANVQGDSLVSNQINCDDQAAPSFSFFGQKVKGSYVGRGVRNQFLNFDWYPEPEPFTLGNIKPSNSVAVILHFFNLFKIHDEQLQTGVVPAGCLALTLESGEWRIVLQALPNKATLEAWAHINNEGGYYLTNVARLERKDGKPFSGKVACEQVRFLENFLSFIKGGRCFVACAVGLDSAGKHTWSAFASPRSSSPPYSWFNPFEASQAELLFPLFARCWEQSKEWEDCLHAAIYWYVQANTKGGSPSIDTAIILAQAALERLAHHYLVIDKKMISLEGFDRLKASDRLRLLFSNLGIPVEIGTETPEIQKAALNFKWMDRPHAITDIRNELIHPASKKKVNGCVFEAWKLYLWYLELSVLALCGYDGIYTSRLTAKCVTDSESVPWGKKA